MATVCLIFRPKTLVPSFLLSYHISTPSGNPVDSDIKMHRNLQLSPVWFLIKVREMPQNQSILFPPQQTLLRAARLCHLSAQNPSDQCLYLTCKAVNHLVLHIPVYPYLISLSPSQSILASPSTHLAYSHLRAFAFIVPSSWNVPVIFVC